MSRRKASDRRLRVVREVAPPATDVAAPPRVAGRAQKPVAGLFELSDVADPGGPPASAPGKGEADPLPEGITTADIRLEMAEMGAPADVLATAESFGEDVAALVSWLRQVTGAQSEFLDALLQHWQVLLRRGATPLDAELCAAEFLMMFEEAMGDVDFVDGVTHFIEEAASTGAPEALAMCRSLAHLGSTEIKVAANRAANTLASAGVKDRPWAHLLGRAELVDAYGYSDDEGGEQSIALEFRYNKTKHVLVVLIDHNLGGGIQDCFVSDDAIRVFAQMRIEALRNGGQLVAHSPQDASFIVHSALAQRPCPVEPDQAEDLSTYLPLLRERLRTMPKPAQPHTPPVSPTDTWESPVAVADFTSTTRQAPPTGRSRGGRGPVPVHRIKVTIAGSKPPIWRRLEVPSAMTLVDLHEVLQTAFEWEGGHLWLFEVGKDTFGVGDLGMPSRDARRLTLGQAAPRKGFTMTYVYDFGDDWRHTIKVEDIGAAEPGATYPRCLTGRRAAPPEDCGGVWGYAELLEILADPAHPEHEDRLDWLGLGLESADEFDPAEFSVEETNDMLEMLAKVPGR